MIMKTQSYVGRTLYHITCTFRNGGNCVGDNVLILPYLTVVNMHLHVVHNYIVKR